MAPFMNVNLTRMRRDAILFRRAEKKAELILSMLREGERVFTSNKKGVVETPLAVWLRGRDLNPGPQGYEPCELPDCSTPRQ